MEHLITNIQNTPPDQYFTVLLSIAPGFLAGVATIVVLIFARTYLTLWLKNYLDKRQITTGWMDYLLQVIKYTYTWFFLVIGIYIMVQTMPYMETVDRGAHKILNFFIIMQIGAWLSHVVREWTANFSRVNRKKDAARVMMVATLERVAYMLIWALAILALLRNFGVDISAMLAGLGIGGLAVAFAFQNILKDIFSSFSIVFDKPFVIDDFISTNDVMGSVEHIGMKTTRIRSLSGEQVVISNNDLLSSRIRNYGRMGDRRVIFQTSVAYNTPPEKLEKIPDIIKGALKHEKVRIDRCHFMAFGSYDLKFETVFFVTNNDYTLMMDIQQAAFLQIIKQFKKEGIQFALPYQQTELVHIVGTPEDDGEIPAKKAKSIKV